MLNSPCRQPRKDSHPVWRLGIGLTSILTKSPSQGEDGDSKVLWNFGILPHHYLASQCRRPWHGSSLAWKLEILC